MAGPKKVTQEEYDEFRSRMEDKYDYENMSDEEKADFDKKIDQVAVVGDKTDKTDNTDSTDGEERERELDHPRQDRDDDDEYVRQLINIEGDRKLEKIFLNSEEYDAAVDAYRSQHGYNDMSDEEKEAFDERLDKVVAKKEDGTDPLEDTESTDTSIDTESGDNRSDSDRLRDELKSQYGYDNMSDEQKRAFDEKLDEVVGQETSEDEEPDQPEKVLRRTR